MRALGIGGMGTVYEVEHELTRHRRALKLLHPQFACNHQAVARFLREASAAGRIGSPHIVETFDAGLLDSGEPYLVMEMLDGRSLADLLEETGKLSEHDAIDWIAQACDGLQAAHDEDAADIERLSGIVEVETNLRLYGSKLTSTAGLEGLRTVGSLDLDGLSSWSTDASSPNPFLGLSGLTSIRGNLQLANVPISSIELNPQLAVEGDVTVNYTSMSCATLQALEQTLAAHGFTGSFQAMFNGNCMGACSQGSCFPVP